MPRHDERARTKQRRQAGRGRLLAVGGGEGCLHVGQALLKDGVEHRSLAVEVVIQHPRGHLGGFSDGVYGGGCVTAHGEKFESGIHEL
jgi:hypothetical protein